MTACVSQTIYKIVNNVKRKVISKLIIDKTTFNKIDDNTFTNIINEFLEENNLNDIEVKVYNKNIIQSPASNKCLIIHTNDTGSVIISLALIDMTYELLRVK